MFCSNCGKKIDDGLRFCPECGAPCRETARFCEMCGARLPEKASKAEEADVDPDTVPEEL